MTGHSTANGKSLYTSSKFIEIENKTIFNHKRWSWTSLTKKILRGLGGYTMLFGINEGPETATQAKKKAHP